MSKNQSIEKSLISQQEFISYVGHELRNPLTTVHGYIQLLKKKLEKEENTAENWVQEIAKANGKITRLVNQMLDINRIKSGRMVYKWQESTVNELLEKAIHNFNTLYPDCQVNRENSDAENVIVIGDSEKLINTIFDCMVFAEKICSSGDSVMLTTLQQSSKCTIRINYRTEELTQEKLERLVEELHQGEENYKDGLGLGIALGYFVLKEHKGDINVKSDKNRTSIEITLPRAKKTTENANVHS